MGEAKRKTEEAKPQQSVVAKITSYFASVKFAVAVVIVIATVCVIGTVLPQGADVARYLTQNPAATSRMRWFGTLGLTHLFYSWWFALLLTTLAASVATCSVRRFATVRRTTGFARRRALGSLLTHISILLILAGGVVRAVWGQKGYVEFREGQTVAQFVGEQGVQPLPFALQLTKFEVETYNSSRPSAPECAMDKKADGGDECCNQLVVQWPEKNVTQSLPVKLDVDQAVTGGDETFTLKILRYVPDFTIDMKSKEISSRSDEPNNPAILVAVAGPNYRNHRWLFAKFPDFVMHTKDGQPTANMKSPLELRYVNHGAAPAAKTIEGPIKSFRSTLKIVESGAVAREVSVEVNRPLAHKGYRFYQSGDNPRDLSYTSLQVVKDPGVPLVYLGFAFMVAGLFIVFYLNPWIESRQRSLTLGGM